MNRRHVLALLSAAAVPFGASPLLAQDIDHPQKQLPTEKLVIVTRDGAHHDFNVEMATSLAQQTVGLMWRTTVPANGGMLFVWDHPQDSKMWMRNTLVPLDMVFINADGTIRSIAENTVPHSLAIIDSNGPVRATLELAGGTTARLGIQVGDKVLSPVFGTS